MFLRGRSSSQIRLNIPVAPLSDMAVTFHLDVASSETDGTSGIAGHFLLRAWRLCQAANFVEPKHVDHWYQVSEIDVQTAPGAGGGGSPWRLHHRRARCNDERQRSMDGCAWRDDCKAHLMTRNIGVSNQGIGGNHLLTDGLGPNVLSRFDRDALAPAGVQWVIVFEGVNDLGGLARDRRGDSGGTCSAGATSNCSVSASD